MKILPILKKKSSKKGASLRDVRKASMYKNLVVKRIPSPFVRKMKRSGKQAIKSMLLSKTFHTSFKIIVGLFISLGIFYGSYLIIGKSFANEVVISQSEIISRVGKLTPLPAEELKDLVRVQDAEGLKKQNEFFQDIEEGDYILIYPNQAIVYDLRNDKIVAIKQKESKTEAKQKPE